MPEISNQKQARTPMAQAMVVLVKTFGSWTSILLHSLFFASWIIFGFNLEVLLVIVSLEAIYIGICILMAENVETDQRERL